MKLYFLALVKLISHFILPFTGTKLIVGPFSMRQGSLDINNVL